MSRCWQINFNPLPEPDSALSAFLEEYFEVCEENYADDGQVSYAAFDSRPIDPDSLRCSAAAAGLTLPPAQVRQLTSDNWLKDYVIRFAPFTVADFMIFGIHETQAPSTDKIPLQIYAATAFGSDHPTTRGCLELISALKDRGLNPAQILDVGTGSGILSLAAAKLWPQSQILAVDLDPEAVLVTQSNMQTNSVDNITAAQSDGYANPEVTRRAPYDLILANILARPLVDMAADLAAGLKTGGYAVLSGFVDNQADWVIDAHRRLGFELTELQARENWRAALLRKIA